MILVLFQIFNSLRIFLLRLLSQFCSQCLFLFFFELFCNRESAILTLVQYPVHFAIDIESELEDILVGDLLWGKFNSIMEYIAHCTIHAVTG